MILKIQSTNLVIIIIIYNTYILRFKVYYFNSDTVSYKLSFDTNYD